MKKNKIKEATKPQDKAQAQGNIEEAKEKLYTVNEVAEIAEKAYHQGLNNPPAAVMAARERTTEEKLEYERAQIRLNETILALEQQIKGYRLAILERQNRISLLKEHPELLDMPYTVLTPAFQTWPR